MEDSPFSGHLYYSEIKNDDKFTVVSFRQQLRLKALTVTLANGLILMRLSRDGKDLNKQNLSIFMEFIDNGMKFIFFFGEWILKFTFKNYILPSAVCSNFSHLPFTKPSPSLNSGKLRKADTILVIEGVRCSDAFHCTSIRRQ